ncbi:hypothetical protein J2T12_001092 [Paenibacillus anaericanus]|uniref:prenylated flavin chaperone LpdD n=1 Tax=Paenibacillus anaericanus TaxID=170367 RepID=UPI00277DEA71|nr:hypothetical protein [Paenibacillus anaericanus]MDQ0087686.1 hypothetical protein [Paenibacillus anaericanus]
MTFDDLQLQAIPMGRDLLLIITGGEVHIGAASTAYWTDQGTEVQTSTVPGHKEHTLSGDIAQRVAGELNRTVTVVMGIHYDDLSQAEIKSIIAKTDSLLEEFLKQQ